MFILLFPAGSAGNIKMANGLNRWICLRSVPRAAGTAPVIWKVTHGFTQFLFRMMFRDKLRLTGNEKFNNRLEEGFQKKYFDLGNEPSLETPFLFNYSGEPWLTQKYSRYVLDNFYDTSPYTGWIGEEDEGQLSLILSCWLWVYLKWMAVVLLILLTILAALCLVKL